METCAGLFFLHGRGDFTCVVDAPAHCHLWVVNIEQEEKDNVRHP